MCRQRSLTRKRLDDNVHHVRLRVIEAVRCRASMLLIRNNQFRVAVGKATHVGLTEKGAATPHFYFPVMWN